MMWPTRTDDPVADHEAYTNYQDYLHGMLPMCEECGNRIEDEFTYEFNDVCICEECLERNHRKFTADLME